MKLYLILLVLTAIVPLVVNGDFLSEVQRANRMLDHPSVDKEAVLVLLHKLDAQLDHEDPTTKASKSYYLDLVKDKFQQRFANKQTTRTDQLHTTPSVPKTFTLTTTSKPTSTTTPIWFERTRSTLSYLSSTRAIRTCPTVPPTPKTTAATVLVCPVCTPCSCTKQSPTHDNNLIDERIHFVVEILLLAFALLVAALTWLPSLCKKKKYSSIRAKFNKRADKYWIDMPNEHFI